jgi:molecular chaperone DnaK
MSKAQSPPSQNAQSAPKASTFSAPAECRYCHQWDTGADDGYCGFCGHLLLQLEVHPESLFLISALAPQKEITFRNASPQPLRAVIVPRLGPKFPALVFEPAGSFDIPPNEEVRIQVGLDEERMPADFQERALQYVCLVNDDPRKQFPLPITVRSGPRPKLLTTALQFGDVQEGRSAERPVEIANSGGTPLKIREALCEGSRRLRLKEPPSQPLLQPGQKVAIQVIWDSSAGEPADDDERAAGVRISFVNHPDSVFVPARARTFRYFLDVRPPEVVLPRVLAKQDVPVKIDIENRGSANLEITAIESDSPWLDVISRAKTFTLLCADEAGKKSGQVSPTTFARLYDFKIVCHPQKLPAGKHQGRITIRPLNHEPKILGVEIDVIYPKRYPDYIGIDFGTTNSVVALFNPETYDIDLVGDDGSKSFLIPSVLVFEDADTYKIGEAARNEVALAPDRSVRSIKRIMGYDHAREFFGRKFSPEELATCIIRKLVQLAERKLHADSSDYYAVNKAIITVPANFYDLQIRDLLKACEAAGLDTEEDKVQKAAQAMLEDLGEAGNAGVVLDEPSAAVLYYIYHLNLTRSTSELMQSIDREGGLRVLVFDYGGGTLDVSIANVIRLETREAGLKILASMGDNGIGGDSIDLILMKSLLTRCREQVQGFDFDISLIRNNFKDLEAQREKNGWGAEEWREILRVRAHWKDLAQDAKIRLATQEETTVDVAPDLIVRLAGGKAQHGPKAVKLTVRRSQLEDLLQEILSKCKGLIDSTLDLAGFRHDQIDYIFHTGRQSLLPIIRNRVREMFPGLPAERDLLEMEHLKVCVAKGAALYGWMRDKLVSPEARILLLSEGRLLAHSYGVEKFSSAYRPEFDEVIKRGLPYPRKESKEYGVELIPRSNYLNLKFYQNSGTNKAIARNPQVSLIGQISFDTMADGVPGCVVTFVIDANRKLEVFADGQAVPIQPVRLQGDEGWVG